MCGIAGIISFYDAPVSRTDVAVMLRASPHRGPDNSGIAIFGDVGFGHNRLAIVDLDPRSNQPMSFGGRYWITFNGEIYNFLELRIELQALGFQFVTNSDTEVILAAYAHWGAECLKKFNGMFAFGIYDSQNREVFLARDRFGEKPLVYFSQGDRFYFGSEIKQLLPLKKEVKPNDKVVLDYLIVGYENHTHESFFAGIRSLEPGSFIKIDVVARKIHTGEYYRLQIEPISDWSETDLAEQASALLQDSIRLRLRSDVQVGASLSGGLDSSLISAIAGGMYSQSGERVFVGIHARSTEPANDESGFAERVAKAKSICLQTTTPTFFDFINATDDVVWTQEEPFGGPSIYMGWHVFQLARTLGCTVMLNGQGADETFLGYERYFPLLRPSSSVEKLKKYLDISRHSRLSVLQAVKYDFYFKNSLVRFRHLANKSLVKSRYLRTFDRAFIERSARSYRDPIELQRLEIESLQLPHLLRYEDRNSMRHSIETRLPFMDYRLVEFALRLPLEMKLNTGWTKFLLRQVANSYLPNEVTWRREKIGFESPTTTWLRDGAVAIKSEVEGSDLANRFVSTREYVRNYEKLPEKIRWSIYNLAVWGRVFNVS
jgi:asparagine synthase (glutamine-hydrolysing)